METTFDKVTKTPVEHIIPFVWAMKSAFRSIEEENFEIYCSEKSDYVVIRYSAHNFSRIVGIVDNDKSAEYFLGYFNLINFWAKRDKLIDIWEFVQSQR